MMIPDVNVILEQLPHTVKGFCVSNADTTFTVVLNSNSSYEQRLKTYYHELGHILNEDHNSNKDIDTIETNAHKD